MNKHKTNYFCNQWQCLHQCARVWMSWHASQTRSWVLRCMSVPAAHGPCSNSQREIWLSSLELASGLGNVKFVNWDDIQLSVEILKGMVTLPCPQQLILFLFGINGDLLRVQVAPLSLWLEVLGHAKVLGPMPTIPGEVGVLGTSHFDRSYFDTWIGLVNRCQWWWA